QPLRGIHAAGNGVAWASGARGTVLRTEDSGYVWQRCSMPEGAEKLDFRSIWAWDAQTAMVMSSGPGDQSRLYKTTDGCAHWTVLGTNKDASGFWDALVFSDRDNGYLLGDPVNGHFTMLRTEDGGAHWKSVTSKDLDLNGQKLGAFAASNLSMVLVGPVLGNVWAPWFGTSGMSGGQHPYVYSGGLDCGMEMAHRNPEGCLARFWTFAKDEVPMAGASESQGIFALGLHRDQNGTWHAVAVGGDYSQSSRAEGTAAHRDTKNGKWTAPSKMPHGYRSSVAWDAADNAWISVGVNGTDVSYDDGQSWSSLGDDGYNAISLPWVVGPQGHIAKLTSLKGK
ncbi:MAG TPA: hypothetical protein VH139_13170, partial [Acidobacteriaceae bacterium]|nr:hypothetical protein [Acidobacteriaceae bacterium]